MNNSICLKNSYMNKVIKTGIIVFFPIVMLMILGPIEVYYSNITDFDFLLKDFFPGFLFASLILWITVTLIISLMPNKLMSGIDAIIFVFSIIAYIQNMFLNAKIAEVDGTEIKWESLNELSVLNLLIWILLFTIGMVGIYILKNRRWRVMAGASIFLSVIQIVAILTCVIGIMSSGKSATHYQLSGENQLSVAPNQNIIVIVLDGLGNGHLNEYINSEELVSGLEDFTYYNNYDSRYYPTFPSMCHLLTGSEPDTRLSRLQWTKEAWNSEHCSYFYNSLHDLGYTCNIYTEQQEYVYGKIENLIHRIDNIEYVESKVNYKLMYPMMLKYSLYRCCPYIFKQRFEVIPSNYRGVVEYTLKEESVENNAEFYEMLVNKGLEINAEWNNAFIVNHILGAHPPYVIDKNAMYVGSDEATRESVLYGCFTIVKEYLSQLQELGLYDKSTIIIMSDHGAGSESGISPENSQAIFLIKEPNVSGTEMKINSSPVCSDDFHATILSILGVNYDIIGKSIYDWHEGERRERTTYFMEHGANGGLFGYTYYYNTEDLRETIIDGYDIKYYNSEW